MKWCASLWVNTLLEKHAWLCAGLVWTYGASQSADMGVYRDVPPETPEARPVVSLFEHWEEGAQPRRSAECKRLCVSKVSCDTILLGPCTTSLESA